jgi:isoleucyl-tRNA synthetase
VSMPDVKPRYAAIPPERPADELERNLLDTWESEELFARVQASAADRPRWTFFEGPPTANGRPGIHHVFARTLKDLFCRHRSMRGYQVLRKAGWDTHGLPVEIEVEKSLGISGKADIERIGVAEFNRLSRQSVWTYREEWERLSNRIAYWLDYDNPYVTYHNEYVESVWWALATLFRKGLLYRGHKILPYCSRCGTTLSSHEVAQGYEDVPDPSLFVALDLTSTSGREVPRREDGRASQRILVWTTTPWTLVSNVALAVHPDLVYAEVRRLGRDEPTIILAEQRLAGALGEDWRDRWEVVRTLRGSEMAGWRYERPIDWLPYGEGKHELIVAESFVSAEDGSGVVHRAPAFGADDYAAGQRHGLAFLQPVDARGRFPESLPEVGGRFVKDADDSLIEYLKRTGTHFRSGVINHSYPHCWRCGTPLLYYARQSWFVRTTAFKDDMLERSRRVNWVPPEIGTGRFGEWLENNIDWAVSRDRYWGTPLPVWVNDEDPDEIEVVGSFAELAERAGRPLPDDFDPHKPFVDEWTWPAPSGKGTMRRVPEVIDAWFDSGSMPFAQWHYPFADRSLVERNFPADWICEGLDQTRGWFYSLLAIATGLGDELPHNEPGTAAPYRAVLVNNLLLDANGQKMSKSRGNVVNPWEVIERHGVDAIRLYLVAGSQVYTPKAFDENAIRETAGRFLVTFKNVYSGIFALYANFGWEPSESDPPVQERPDLDRWVLSRLTSTEREVDDMLERFDATGAARRIMSFVVDDLSNWYVRLSRDRFYDVDGDDNRAAFATLHTALVSVCRLLAPIAPFITDWMHRELTGVSVHLASYVRPESDPSVLSEPELEAAMEEIRELATLGRAAREVAGVRVRQPLSRMVCVVPSSAPTATVQRLVPLLAEELNVKRIEFANDADDLVTLEAKPDFRSLGKRFGKQTPLAAAAVAALPSERLMSLERGEPVSVNVEGAEHALLPDDVKVIRRARGALVVQEAHGRFAALDPEVTDDLRREGIARELVSRIQRLRKESGLEVSDRIRLWIAGGSAVDEAVAAFGGWISEETLARELHVGEAPQDTNYARAEVDLEGVTARLALTRE